MTITQLCEKVNVYCAKLNSIVTARGGIYFFILGETKNIHQSLNYSGKYATIYVSYIINEGHG